MAPPLEIALIGAGDRGAHAYADYCRRHPSEARVVAVADPHEGRREAIAELYGIPHQQRHASWEQLLSRPSQFDGVVIATPDRIHVAPALRGLELGYDILLEKPIAPTKEDVLQLADAAGQLPGYITVAHVLRYTPFFSSIKRFIDDGEIGQLISFQYAENIGYWHFAHSFVRGNWSNAQASSSMLLQKACHDMDMLRWLVGASWQSISSFGELSYFRPDRAPDGAPERCIDGCPVYETCPFNAVTYYVETLAGHSGWPVSVISTDLSREGRLRALTEGPYGRCVYGCKNDVVDHQEAVLSFNNGVSGTLNVCATTSENTRTLKLMGSIGELRGHLEKGEIEIRRFGPAKRKEQLGARLDLWSHSSETTAEFRSDVFRVSTDDASHNGGDEGLMRAFIERIRTHKAGHSSQEALTSLDQSLESYFMVFAAEESRLQGRVIRSPHV